MEKVSGPESWNAVLQKHRPLVLPAAHDALSARLIESAGFPAYQIGGFALVGARYGQPDIDLIHLGERRASIRDIMTGSSLPVLVDLDDGYGDVKNVTFAVRCMEAMRVSAVFIEDQQAPKKCGQMDDKHVISSEDMVAKVRAAAAARSSRQAMYLIARTDALEPDGLPPSRARLRPPSQGSARLLRATPVRKARAALLEGAPRRVALRFAVGLERWQEVEKKFQA
ncbi:MAG: isocitrate lyase/PEP mutase family protein [Deltaproteobacteria bacterium]|nr:MAG: isocitrate lyase/PEP mutase family protein [Deltaproteobacteria bacterium]